MALASLESTLSLLVSGVISDSSCLELVPEIYSLHHYRISEIGNVVSRFEMSFAPLRLTQSCTVLANRTLPELVG